MEAAPPQSQPPSWSDIPMELAGLVLGRLPALVDRVRFAAVCPQWRAAAQQGRLPPPMPLLLLPDGTVHSLPGSEPFRFPDCVGYTDACGTANWLVFKTEDGFFLRDPLSKATVTLPPLARARLQHVGDEFIDEAGHAWMEMGETKERSASKIIFCSPHLIAAIFTFRGVERTRIAVCQPGATSWWSIHVGCPAPLFSDIVLHQGKLYALDCTDTLFAVDISVDHNTGDPWVSQIQQVIEGRVTRGFIFLPNNVLILTLTYLVESCGALLLVCREIDLKFKEMQWDRIEVLGAEGNRFEVYEADFGQSWWAKVTTLGNDQVLFLHRQCCRSVCISHYKMPGDRIFFMDYNEVYYDCIEEGASSSYCVYDMRDGKFSTPLPMVSWKPGRIFATWLFPQG